MTLIEQWQEALHKLPLVAILRGITPEESIPVATVLCDAGFTLIEVPLNSPSPLKSIEQIRNTVSDGVLVGAGTVLTSTQVTEVTNAGGQLIIAPNFCEEVAKACRDRKALYCPGVATPTEAFNALRAGAAALKLFPAEIITPAAVKAIRAVLPTDIALLPVGGIDQSNMHSYIQAGANGFGIGSALYKPGDKEKQIAHNAQRFIATINNALLR